MQQHDFMKNLNGLMDSYLWILLYKRTHCLLLLCFVVCCLSCSNTAYPTTVSFSCLFNSTTMKDFCIVVQNLVVTVTILSSRQSSQVDAFLPISAELASNLRKHGMTNAALNALAVQATGTVNHVPQQGGSSGANRMMDRLKSRLEETKTRLQKYRNPNDSRDKEARPKPRCMPEKVVNIHDYKAKVADEKNHDKGRKRNQEQCACFIHLKLFSCFMTSHFSCHD
jgi:hypothetical protein